MRIAVCGDCMEDTLSLKKFMRGHEVRGYFDNKQLGRIKAANGEMRK
ncbi:MAG: hypothetical protein K2H52_03875 [Lachnospiraceae bacterium]|nr:hypothetical protein [Lachnospiraceae bacterium]MDE6186030.1 hypothetical protein [Lachnospiraceae bacterium]